MFELFGSERPRAGVDDLAARIHICLSPWTRMRLLGARGNHGPPRYETQNEQRWRENAPSEERKHWALPTNIQTRQCHGHLEDGRRSILGGVASKNRTYSSWEGGITTSLTSSREHEHGEAAAEDLRVIIVAKLEQVW